MVKNIFKLFLFPVFTVIVFPFLFAEETYAAQFIKDDYTLESDEILYEDLYIAGGKVEINGIVDGDVYIASQDTSISGSVSGNVYIGSEYVDISGTVYGDLVAVGSEVSVSGTVSEDAYLLGAYITDTASVSEDLILIGGSISSDSMVSEDLMAVGGEVSVESSVGEDLSVYGMSLSLDDADVSGDTYQEEGEYSTQDFDFVVNPELSWTTLFSTTLILAASFYLVGALMIYIMPVKTQSIVKRATGSGEGFIKSFAIGFVVLFIAFIPTVVLLSITVIGIPLACIIGAVLLFLAIYGRLWVEIGLGKILLGYLGEKKPSPYISLLAGRCLSVLINLIPVIGTIYTLVLTLVGIGSAFDMKFELMSAAKRTPSKTKKN